MTTAIFFRNSTWIDMRRPANEVIEQFLLAQGGVGGTKSLSLVTLVDDDGQHFIANAQDIVSIAPLTDELRESRGKKFYEFLNRDEPPLPR